MPTTLTDQIYYRIIGEGMPVLMIHGMGVDHRTMKGCLEPVFQSRADQWKRIYLDLPGMGRTPAVDWIASSDELVSFLLSFIDQVIPDQPFLIAGESYGGYLARGLIHHRQEPVAGLLLICPLVKARDDQRDVPPCTVLRRNPTLQRELTAEQRTFVDLFLADQNQANWERFRAEMLLPFQTGDHAFQSKIRDAPDAYALSFDVDELDHPFEKPTLILAGRQDCLVGYRDAWKILDNYPRASFVALDIAGHALQIEQPTLFDALVHEWLDRVEQNKGQSPTGSDQP